MAQRLEGIVITERGWESADKGIALLVEVLTEGDVTASELIRIAGEPLRKQ